ncbi:uncharacterized protein LOC112557254 isoform X2 [Pomacea canaliculata]|uniref:uncharacterized protein LOC112557254 isoform X2 n=1 Tax=Pomacea canaliculata TaxID=400727 RepID=UPI000D72EA14|nr:uncharacterized protein LOC112557254 isoform X2 [Pomacea canaliculata]
MKSRLPAVLSLGVTTSASKGNGIVVKNNVQDDVNLLEHKVYSTMPACGLSTRGASVYGATVGARESIPNVGRRALRSRHPLVLQGFPVGAPHAGQVVWAEALTSPASRRPRNHRQINDLAVSLPIKTYPSTLRRTCGQYYAQPDQQVKVGAGDQHVPVGVGGLLPRQKIERLLVSIDRKNSLSECTARYSQRHRQHHHKTYLQLKSRLQHQQLGTQTTFPAEHLLTSHKIPVDPVASRHLKLRALAYRHKARGRVLRQHQTPSTLIRWHQAPDGATGCKSVTEHSPSNYSRRSEVERASCSKTDPQEEACSRVKLPPISSGGQPRHLDMMEYLWVYQGMSRQVLRPLSGCEDRDPTFHMASTSHCCMCVGTAGSASVALTDWSRRQILASPTPTLATLWVNESLINMAKISKINANKDTKDKGNNSSSFLVREGRLLNSRDRKMSGNGYGKKKKIIVTLPVISRDTSSKDLHSDDRHQGVADC